MSIIKPTECSAGTSLTDACYDHTTYNHYTIKFRGKLYPDDDVRAFNYCYFSLPVERSKQLIPLNLHNIIICNEKIVSIDSKIFDEGIYRISPMINIKLQVDDWLRLIDAQFIHYTEKVGLLHRAPNDSHRHIIGCGEFDIELSDRNPMYNIVTSV